jgi:hypothetical protein
MGKVMSRWAQNSGCTTGEREVLALAGVIPHRRDNVRQAANPDRKVNLALRQKYSVAAPKVQRRVQSRFTQMLRY